MKVVAKNNRAKFDYELIDKYVAGVSLYGSEVKSIKAGDVDLTGSYVVIDNKGNPQWLNGLINHYEFQTMEKHDERRTRQLLLNKREIRKIRNDITLKRLTIIPYVVGVNSRGLIKIELYTAKGKKLHDKRETIKERDSQRESRIKY